MRNRAITANIDTQIVYTASASIRLLESCTDRNAGMGFSTDIFHLAILAQLGNQMQKLSSGQGSVPHSFGTHLVTQARNVAWQKVRLLDAIPTEDDAERIFDTQDIGSRFDLLDSISLDLLSQQVPLDGFLEDIPVLPDFLFS